VTLDSDTTFKVKSSKVNLQVVRHIVAASRTTCLLLNSSDGTEMRLSALLANKSLMVSIPVTKLDALNNLFLATHKFTETVNVFDYDLYILYYYCVFCTCKR